MRVFRGWLGAVAGLGVVAGLGGCNTSVSGPAMPTAGAPADGFVHYATGGRVMCDGRPISVDASHARVEASGACGTVRVTGEHNDVIVGMAPGGRIEVTGAHNDVWWHTTGPGPHPVVQDKGASNTLHREEV